MKLPSIAASILLCLAFTASTQAQVSSQDFGSLPDNTAVRLFTITNKTGSSVQIMTYGATVVSLKMPDRAGQLADIVLGFDNLHGYLGNNPYFGATVGRYANRIHGAKFSLDGVQYNLTPNAQGNTLHGGRRGFDKVVWSPATIDARTVEFTYVSRDGEEGFPGNLTVHARYSLSDANELTIDYSATTDKLTIVNLTNHSYFNLAGAGNGDVLNHLLTIYADQYTPTDDQLIPTGRFADVAGTPFDFRQPHKIGQRIDADNPQLRFGNGYDENFVLTQKDGLHPAAVAYEPVSGRVLELSTTEPGLQLYSANGLDGSIIGKDGRSYPQHGAFCLEPGHFPDSPNHPEFPSTELAPGQVYHSTIVYKFSTRPSSGIDLSTGWTALQEGQAIGTIDPDARQPANSHPHILEIAVTKTADPGQGRAGATSDVHFAVKENEWYDITFTAVTARASVGLVFSLETSDGSVLARTTLPEIGGRPRRPFAPPSTSPAQWRSYLVGLHARGSDSAAHLVITPIEPTDIWLDSLTLTPRQAE